MLGFLFSLSAPSSHASSASSPAWSYSSHPQPISLILQQLVRLLVFCRDNTVVAFLFILLLSTLLWLFGFNFLLSRDNIHSLLRSAGLSSLRTRRCITELRRKSFHLLGLLIPMIQYMGMRYTPQWLDQKRCSVILAVLTLCLFLVEVMRFSWPWFRSRYSRLFASVLRKTERSDERVVLTGMVFFFAGNFLSVFLFDPTIATAASLYLVLGDLTAAIVGISFGRFRLPSGKSIEGSFAMFIICCVVGTVLFWHVPLAEYPVMVGASVATIAELLLPKWFDDNLSIPLLSGLALHLAFRRIGQSPPLP